MALAKKMAEETYDPTAWLLKWPHKEAPLWEAWREVYARFGIAAERSAQLETGLVMLIARPEQILNQQVELDGLLAALRKNGVLTLGALITLFRKLYRIQENHDLAVELAKAKKARNYLIHHFYRDQSELLRTPEGCEKAVGILVGIFDDIDAALQYLGDWRDKHFGYEPPEDRWEEINQDVAQWRTEQQQMLDAFLGNNKRRS